MGRRAWLCMFFLPKESADRTAGCWDEGLRGSPRVIHPVQNLHNSYIRTGACCGLTRLRPPFFPSPLHFNIQTAFCTYTPCRLYLSISSYTCVCFLVQRGMSSFAVLCLHEPPISSLLTPKQRPSMRGCREREVFIRKANSLSSSPLSFFLACFHLSFASPSSSLLLLLLLFFSSSFQSKVGRESALFAKTPRTGKPHFPWRADSSLCSSFPSACSCLCRLSGLSHHGDR